MAAVLFFVFAFFGLNFVSSFSLRAGSGELVFTVDQDTGAYTVSIGDNVWLNSAPTSFRNNNQTYSTADGSLELVQVSGQYSGQDALGPFVGVSIQWQAKSEGTPFVTSVRSYGATLVFAQIFPEGANWTSLGDTQTVKNELISSFPAFAAEEDSSLPRGFVQWSGDMVGSGPVFGVWGQGSLNGGSQNSGPFVLFTEDLATSIVVSSFSNFMAHSFLHDNNVVSFGILGSVQSVPVGYEISTIIALGSGINSAMENWGNQLLAKYGKTRADREADFTLAYIGYSTDNGAYYYYNTEVGKNYEQTLLDVKTYAESQSLPYQYVLLDSWWYYKGVNDGVKEWLAMPSIFPDGLDYVRNATSWIIQGHNRYWAIDNVYAKQNGGQWNFVIEPADGAKEPIALPLDQEFWDWFLSSSALWGLRVYEQDWLDVQFDNTNYLLESATAARTWLMQMGTAAAKNGMTIQYCMSHCRHIMQSVELPAVTQARASGDYAAGNGQWDVGTTGIFAYSLGIAPSKDNYWSTTVQPGNPYGPSRVEPYNRLESAVSSLSRGPVAPSDMVGGSDASLIMRACASDGKLLRPDKPATEIDAYFVQQAFGSGGPEGEVWTTYSTISGFVFYYVFAVDLASPYTFNISQLSTQGGSFVAFESNTTDNALPFNETTPIELKACMRSDFQLYTVSPVFGNGWAFLGEQDKWIAASADRFDSLFYDQDTAGVIVKGMPGEEVNVSFLAPGATAPIVVACTIGDGSANVVRVPAGTCTAV